MDSGFALINNSSVTANDVGTTLLGGAGHGGGMHLENFAVVVMNGGQIGNNVATTVGGGVWADRNSQMFVQNGASIRDNRVSQANSSEVVLTPKVFCDPTVHSSCEIVPWTPVAGCMLLAGGSGEFLVRTSTAIEPPIAAAGFTTTVRFA